MACPQMSMCIFFFFNYVQNSREKETATARCGLSLNYAEAIFTSLPLSNFTRPALLLLLLFFVLILNFLDSIPFALTFVLFRTFPTLFHFVFHLH